jgi:hypothetical protein
VLGACVERHATEPIRPSLIFPNEIALINERAAPDHEQAVEVCLGERCEPLSSSAEHGPIKADVFGSRDAPSIRIRNRHRISFGPRAGPGRGR